MKFLTLILFLVICALPLNASQDTLFIKCLDGKKRALGVHAPNSNAKSKKSPLVLWLHGGVNGTKKDRGAEVAHYFSKESDSLGFIFAAPSGERGATWYDEVGIDNIKKCIIAIKKNYRVDTTKIILAGVSDGGTGAYIAAAVYPEFFSGYAVLSGSYELPGLMGVPLNSSVMKGKRWLIAHGGKDHLYSGTKLQEWVAVIKREGVEVDFEYFPEAPHGLDYMPLLKNNLLKFFLSGTR